MPRTSPSGAPNADIPGPDLGPDRAFASWCEFHRTPILLLAAFAAFTWTLLFFSFTADDAFISFRYAQNLLLHHLWNWNPSGPREDACTSAIYAALAVVPAVLHLPTVLFFKLVGLACFAWIMLRLRTLAGSTFASLLGILVLGLSPLVWIHVYSGLETPLYILLILEMAIAVMRSTDTAPAWVYTLFLLLPLTRPEGFLFACAGVFLFWRARSNRQDPRPIQLPAFFAAIALGIAYFTIRALYFHHLFPNPFYVKVPHQPLRDLLNQTIANLSAYRCYVFTVILVAVLARKSITRAFALCSLLLMLLLFAPHIMSMNFADRFYLQLTLPVLLLFFLAEDLLPLARFAATLAALFLFALSPADLLLQLKYPAAVARAHFDIGHRLAPFAHGHTLIAADVGGIPFYSNWTSYDYRGIATNTIAQHGVTPQLLQAVHPDLVIFYSGKPGPALLTDKSWVGGSPSTGRALVDYVNTTGFDYAASSKANGFYLVSFLRKDTPQHDAILSNLQRNSLTSNNNPTLTDILLQRYLPSSR